MRRRPAAFATPSRLPRLRVRLHALLLAPLLVAGVALCSLLSDDDVSPSARVRAREAARRDALALAPGVGAAAAGAAPHVDLAVGEEDAVEGDRDGSSGREREVGVVIDGRRRGARGALDGAASSGDGGEGDADGPGGAGRRGRRGASDGVDAADAPTALTGAGGEPGGAPTKTTDGEGQEGWPVGTGITGDYFDHAIVLDRVPRLGAIAPTFTRVDATIDFMSDESFGLPFHADTFVVRWSGWFLAETEGTYRFRLGCDDGARLDIDNATVVEHDGLHPHEEREAEVELGAGFHPLQVVFFDNHVYASVRLEVAPPGGGPMAVVPQRWLFPADTTPMRELPVVDQVRPDHAPERAAVELIGHGFGDLPGYASVKVGDAVARVVEVTPTRMLIEVPEGTDGGPIVVSVGGAVSPGVAFTVDGVFGLHARFEDTGPDPAAWVSLPPGAAVDHERIDGQVVFPDAAAFGLPFPMDGVSSQWRGHLFVHRPGKHAVWVTCDDGARLWLDGDLVIDDSGGLHPPRETGAEVVLGWGRHELILEHFQGPGGAALVVDIAPDGQPRRPVPRGWLTPPDAVRAQRPPVVAKLEPARAAPGDQVVILGEALVDPAVSATVVTLNGLRCEVVSPGWSSLVVRIPPGNPESGPLVVRVGPHQSAPVPFEVTGFGVTGEYWDFDHDLDHMPELDALGPPTHARIDPQVEFQEEAGFKLPFAPDTFAARWRASFVAPVEGTYRFVVGSDDGTRLTVAGQRLLEDSGLHGYWERSGEVWLPAGPSPLVLEFFENWGEARARLMVVPPGGGQIVVPRSWLRPAP